MTWASRTSPIQVGDDVAYSRAWLQSIHELTGQLPQARGKVLAIQDLGGLVVAKITWDRPDIPERVNIRNLAKVRDGQVMERD